MFNQLNLFCVVLFLERFAQVLRACREPSVMSDYSGYVRSVTEDRFCTREAHERGLDAACKKCVDNSLSLKLW